MGDLFRDENGNVEEKLRIHLIMCKYIQYYNTVHVTKPIIENSESIKIIMDKMYTLPRC